MSTILPTSLFNNSDLTSLLSSGLPSAGATTANAQQPASTNEGGSTKSSLGSATIIDLSDHAKAILDKAKTDQVVADRLAAQVQAARGNGKFGAATKSTTGDGSSLFAALTGQSASKTSGDTKWQAGDVYGDASISDAEFTSKNSSWLSTLADDYQYTPEEKQALQDAINHGTLNIQAASDVPGLNAHSTVTYTPSSVGGGPGVTVSGGGGTPTGAAADAISQHRAFSFWSPDRGDVFVSW